MSSIEDCLNDRTEIDFRFLESLVQYRIQPFQEYQISP